MTDTLTFRQLRAVLVTATDQEKRWRDTPQGFYEQERLEERHGLGDRWPPLKHDLRWIESQTYA